MFDIEASLDGRILALAKNRPTVVFIEPLDPRVIEAVCYLTRFIRPVFLAPEEAVREAIARDLAHLDPIRVKFALSESAFVDLAERTDLIEEFAQACTQLPPDVVATHSLAEARELVRVPAKFGVMAVRLGLADMVAGGVQHAPKDFFRPLLRLLQMQRIQCEAGVFVLPDDFPHDVFPHNIIVFGDVGVNATMTPEILAHCAVGTCAVARDLIPEDVLPEIHGAIVSYSHRGMDEGPSAELVREAMKLVPDVLAERVSVGARYASIKISGPVKVSVALSRRSAAYYSHPEDSELAGRTNVIICPNLDMGNLLYHLYAARFPASKKFTAMFGLRFRGVDLPMDATAEDARLAIKASVLRLHRFGHWSRTPRDTFFRRYRILAVNPGSTSTKIGVFEGDQEAFVTELQHSAEELRPYESQPIIAQYALRKEAVVKALAEHDLTLDDLDAVSARGGLLRPIPHGTYRVDDRMRADLQAAVGGEHASNLGALIARELVAGTDKPAFIVDPVVVDEVPERVKITGFKAIRRKVISHALNQIATARRFAEENETFYENLNLIVCHMGGGITIGAHKKGQYIDVNNGLNGEGPFTPQRSGSLPPGQLIDLCFSGRYTQAELKQLNKGRGGLIDLLGTADFREVERRVLAGDPQAAAVVEAMVYQIAKNIAALLPAFDGELVDRVLLTGGLARSQLVTDGLEKAVRALGCGVTVYPGENEMAALAKGALRVLQGKEDAREYRPEEKR